jgi:hypothetical protein
MRHLQSVQQAAARLIFNLKRYDRITDALISQHWLRIPERIRYKVVVLTHKISMVVLRGTSDHSFASLSCLVDMPSVLLVPTAW